MIDPKKEGHRDLETTSERVDGVCATGNHFALSAYGGKGGAPAHFEGCVQDPLISKNAISQPKGTKK